MHPSQCIHVDQFLYNLAVLGLDKVGKGLGLLVAVVVVAVVVVLRSDVLHLVDAAALGASLNGALAVHLRLCHVSSVFYSRYQRSRIL